MNFKPIFILILLLITTFSCKNRSLESFREEGESITRSLIKELSCIHTKQELIAASPQLKKLFNRLIRVIIAARQTHTTPSPLIKLNHELSDELRTQIKRICLIDGAASLLEKCQQEALLQLDAYEKKRVKTRHLPSPAKS